MTPPPRRPDDDTPFPPLPPLPVAEPVRPDPLADDPVVAEVVESRTDDPESLPVAVPVRPPRSPDRDPPRRPRPVAPPPEPRDEAGPRPRVLAACSVLGCLGLGVVVAVGFLAYGAIRILNHVGDRMSDPDRAAAVGAAWPRPDPVGPTRLAGESATVQVGGPYDAVGRAAGGRFLLFRVPAQRRVVAFDANAGAMRSDFALGLTEPNSLFAGGAAKLWVYKPRAKELVRCDLLTGSVEQRAAVPRDVPDVDVVAVGAGSNGPVYLVSATPGGVEVRTFDGVTLGQTGMTRSARGVGRSARARASDDGTLLAVSGQSAALAVRFQAGEPRWAALEPADGGPPGVAVPAPDGSAVYTARGVFGPDGTLGSGARDEDPFYTLPPAQGSGLYLGLGVSPRGRLEGPLRVYPAGSRQTLFTLPEVRVPGGLEQAARGEITPDQRVYLWPAAGLAATLPPAAGDTIELTKVDVAAALDAARGDYLLFGSDPPTTAVRGREWRYAPVVWSRQGVRLELGGPPPAGMRLDGGTLTWTPGADVGPAEVVVRATAGGRSAEQRFRVVVDR